MRRTLNKGNESAHLVRCVTVAEMRALDAAATRNYSIPSLLLMENAGRSVADIIARVYKPCQVVIFSGKGNNGGDGFVVARHLSNQGYSVEVITLGDISKLTHDSSLNYSILQKMNISIVSPGEDVTEKDLLGYCLKSSVVIDAIFGIGINDPVRGVIEKAIRAINQSERPVVSIDIPSGLDADAGKIHGVAVRATTTITLGLPKRGLFIGEGPRQAGGVEVGDIGLPRELVLPFLE